MEATVDPGLLPTHKGRLNTDLPSILQPPSPTQLCGKDAPVQNAYSDAFTPGKKRSVDSSFEPEDQLIDNFQEVQRDLLLATLEHQQLKDMNTSLIRLNNQSKYVEDLLTNAGLSCSLLPSSLVGPRTTEAVAHLVDAIWCGTPPQSQFTDEFWAKLSIDEVTSLDIGFKKRLFSEVTLWRAAGSPARVEIENAISNAIRERCRVARVLALKSPRVLMGLCKKGLPASPAEAQRAKQQLIQLVKQLNLRPQQRILITEIWKRYSETMVMVNGQIEAARLALIATSTAVSRRSQRHGLVPSSMLSQANHDLCMDMHIEDLNLALNRSIVMFQRVCESLTYTLTWRQYVTLSADQFPKMTNFAQVCEIIALELDQ